jgi:hypothetical protein
MCALLTGKFRVSISKGIGKTHSSIDTNTLGSMHNYSLHFARRPPIAVAISQNLSRFRKRKLQAPIQSPAAPIRR